MKMTRGSTPYKSPGMRKMAEGGSVKDKPKRKVVTTTGKEISGKRADKIRKAAAEGKSEVRTGLFGLGKRYKIKQPETKATPPSTRNKPKNSAPTKSVRPKARPGGSKSSPTKYKTSDRAKSEVSKGGYKTSDQAKAESTGGDRKRTGGKPKKVYSGRGKGPQGPTTPIDKKKPQVQRDRADGKETTWRYVGAGDEQRRLRRAKKQLSDSGNLMPRAKTKQQNRRSKQKGSR